MKEYTENFKAVVIGVSLGAIDALKAIFSSLPQDFSAPIVVVQHLLPSSNVADLIRLYSEGSSLPIGEARLRESIVPGRIYFAPPGYHLLIEKDHTFSLDLDDKINFSRPSIDVLFESAADAFGPNLIGVVLTGANSDGSAGLKKIRGLGGYAIVQEPSTSYADTMPSTAIQIAGADEILPIGEIGPTLTKLCHHKKGEP